MDSLPNDVIVAEQDQIAAARIKKMTLEKIERSRKRKTSGKGVKYFTFGSVAAACLLVLTFVGVAFISNNDQKRTAFVDEGSVQGVPIPEWYVSQRLNVTTVTYDLRINKIDDMVCASPHNSFVFHVASTAVLSPVNTSNDENNVSEAMMGSAGLERASRSDKDTSDTEAATGKEALDTMAAGSGTVAGGSGTVADSSDTMADSSGTTTTKNIKRGSPESGTVFNQITHEVFDPKSLIREKLSLSDKFIITVCDHSPGWEYIYFDIFQDNYPFSNYVGEKSDYRAYLMQVSTGAYKQLPSEIQWDRAAVRISDNGRYLSADVSREKPYGRQLYIVDSKDMSVRLLADIYQIPHKGSLMDAEFSSDNEVLFYTTTDPVTGADPQTGHFYHVKTGVDVSCPIGKDNRDFYYVTEHDYEADYLDADSKYNPEGLLNRVGRSGKYRWDGFCDGSRYYMGVSTKDNMTPMIVDTRTGEQVDVSVLEDTVWRYRVEHMMSNVRDGNLYRFDLLDEEQAIIVEGAEGSERKDVYYTVSKDGQYAYCFMSGDDFVKCINVMTLQSFDVPLNKAFTDQIEEFRLLDLQEIDGWHWDLSLHVSEDNTDLVIKVDLSEWIKGIVIHNNQIIIDESILTENLLK